MVAGLLLLGACSGDDSAGSSSISTTAVAPLSTPPSTPSTSSTTSTAAPIATPTTAEDTTPSSTTSSTATTTTLPPTPLKGLALESVATGLHQPTAVASAPGDPRLFVTERRGTVRVIDDGALLEEPFLDIADRVNWAAGIEQGMLGLAFHPDFAVNGRFFVYYTGEGDARRIAEYAVSDDPNRADSTSEKLLLTRPQPSDIIRHYAGHLEFGPDGYLYAALGDGAAGEIHGQDPETVFGAILRIDIDFDGGGSYAIPADNPFATGGGAAEVWVYGLRNPWRFNIDGEGGLVYIADVGQDSFEEINAAPLDGGGGTNFGWPDTEGSQCFLLTGCDLSDYALPVFEYSHDVGCSVTGGVVYRGSAIPELTGHYFYADWCRQWVRSFRLEDGQVVDETDWTDQLSAADQVQAFGVDDAGEVYLVNFAGEVFRLVPLR